MSAQSIQDAQTPVGSVWFGTDVSGYSHATPERRPAH